MELTLEEVREWPPELDDDDLIGVEGSEEERSAEYDFIWQEKFEEGIAEARLLLGLARMEFGETFTPAAVRHLDPSARDRLRQIMPSLPAALVHPIRTRRQEAQRRRDQAALHALYARLPAKQRQAVQPSDPADEAS